MLTKPFLAGRRTERLALIHALSHFVRLKSDKDGADKDSP